jgi:DNA-binding YbaB/EbfC family protein
MSMGNFNPDVLRQAQSVQKNLMRLREELKERVVEADAGGGLVKAYTNGNGELVKLSISPDAIDTDDLGLLEDLVVAAVLKSQEVANELQQTEMNKVTGGLSLPGLF